MSSHRSAASASPGRLLEMQNLKDHSRFLNRNLHINSFSKWIKEFPASSMVKNQPAMWETWVQPLGWEDALEEGMATHSIILDWRIPTDRGGWQAMVHGVVKSQTQLSN